jgi:hypothetical protein
MPQHSTAQHSTRQHSTTRIQPDHHRPSAPEPSAAKAPDLTVNKILAGAGAAATTAVLGSFFGAAGTVTGAALGSVVSTVGTTIYQRSLDRTRDTVKARIRLPGGRTVDVAGPATVPAPRVAPDGESGQARVSVTPAQPPGPAKGRRALVATGAAVLVFLLGLLVVTGLEFAKGSTLATGQSGTSVGRVLDTGPPPAVDPAPVTEPAETTEPTTDPSDTEPAPSEEPATPAPTDGSTSEAPEPTPSEAPDEAPEDTDNGPGGILPTLVPGG